MRLWINHPAFTAPVGLHRWLAYHVGDLLQQWGRRLEYWAIGIDDEIPF